MLNERRENYQNQSTRARQLLVDGYGVHPEIAYAVMLEEQERISREEDQEQEAAKQFLGMKGDDKKQQQDY